LGSIVINTEAHIFPRFKLTRGLKTGWERRPRDADGKLIQPARSEITQETKVASAAANIHTIKVEEVGQIPLADETVAEPVALHSGHG